MKLNNIDEAKVAIDYFIMFSKCIPYFVKNENISFKDLEEINHNMSMNEYEKIKYIWNKYIKDNKNLINSVFLEYSTNEISKKIEECNKEKFLNSFEKLLNYSNIIKIPIFYFPKKRTDNCINITSFNDREEIKFIKFIDEEKEYLTKEKISISNQFINFLAHELGHSIDVSREENLLNEKYYILKREKTAWENAKKIQEYLKIEDTQIKEHSELAYCTYLKKPEEYFKNKAKRLLESKN